MNSFQSSLSFGSFQRQMFIIFYAKSKVDLCKARRKTHHTTVSTQNGGLFQSFEPFNVLFSYLFIYIKKIDWIVISMESLLTILFTINLSLQMILMYSLALFIKFKK